MNGATTCLLKSRQAGGGTVTATTTHDNGGVVVSIADTGLGIEPERLRRIFEPFFSTKDHGTGLGLAITQRVVEEHGGAISAHSEVGKGTTIELGLPLTVAGEDAARDAPKG